MTDEEQVLGVFHAFIDAFARRDLPAIRETFVHDPDVVFFGTHAQLHYESWAAFEGFLHRQLTILDKISVDVLAPAKVRLTARRDAASVTAADVTFRAEVDGSAVKSEHVRITAFAEKTPRGFQFVQMHWSTPADVPIAMEENINDADWRAPEARPG